MKNQIRLIIAVGLLVMVCSCGNTEKKSTDKKVEKTSKRQTSTEIKYAKDNQWKEQLKLTEPIAFEDLKAWLPKSLGGIPLTSSKSLFPMFKGQSEILGRYDDLKAKRLISLNLYDAAGPEGWSFCDQITEHRKVRPDQDVGGMKMRTGFKVKDWSVRQSYSPEKNYTAISFFHDERIMIMFTASNFNVEESWDLIGELDFSALSELIKQ